MFIGICDPAVVFFPRGIVDRVRVRIAPLPERLDKLFAFLVGLQCAEKFAALRP